MTIHQRIAIGVVLSLLVIAIALMGGSADDGATDTSRDPFAPTAPRSAP